uniref:Ig-like domain-containing protein n=1 Tax=Poecilia mexicana TaxID=48701 RepID=A0A3B3WE28_9TELE
TVLSADTEVTCVFSQSCILPCSFQFTSDSLIHWIYPITQNSSIHSYYHNKDQLGHQNQSFQNRTSLFLDQLSRGNASLLLKEVKIQDEGRYKCYTSNSRGQQDSFIRLKIEAPVSDIRIHQDGNRITCSSEGIYPQPELTWSTEPPSNTALQNRTTVHQTEEKLYDISSSLTGPDGPDLTYSCSIRTRRNQKTATSRSQRTSLPSAAPEGSSRHRVVSMVMVGAAVAVVTVVLVGKYKMQKLASAQHGGAQNEFTS